MIARLFKQKRTARPIDTASVPEGRRVYAIGDIHGRNDLFRELLALIDKDDRERGPASSQLILLGDLVDRGPDSRGVIETAMQLAASGGNVRFIAGNHEEVFLQALAHEDTETTRFFYRIGGRETILSYGIDPDEFLSLDMEGLTGRLKDLVPDEHAAFLEKFDDQVVVGDYLFVHAGIRPGVPLDQQRRKHLRWIRDEFLDYPGDHEKVVVHGHTITEDIEEGHCRIGIDTGAWESGRLTAIGLEGTERWYIQTGGESDSEAEAASA